MEFPSMAFTERSVCQKVTNVQLYYTPAKITKVKVLIESQDPTKHLKM